MLVPDDVISSIVKKELLKDEYAQGVILDGYPRNIVQAETLDEFLEFDYVIFIDISDEEAVKRVTGRRVCPNCGANYHIDYKPSEKKGVCNLCAGRLEIREDSTPEAVETRLKVYHLQTEPLVSYYKNKGILIEVDGEQPIPEVFNEILEKFESHGIHN
jgi:adenylate kinase